MLFSGVNLSSSFCWTRAKAVCEAVFLFSPQWSGPQFQSGFNKQELTSRHSAKHGTDLDILGMDLLPVFTVLSFSKANSAQ